MREKPERKIDNVAQEVADEVDVLPWVINLARNKSSEVNHRCPLLTKDNANYKIVGKEKTCAGCPWRINAPEYLNCAFIGFSGGEHSIQEIANALSVPTHTVEDLINSIGKKIAKTAKRPEFKEVDDYIEEQRNKHKDV